MKNYNLIANGIKMMDYDSLLQHFERCKNELQKGTLEGIEIYILANYDGYITAINEKGIIFQAWAGQITI